MIVSSSYNSNLASSSSYDSFEKSFNDKFGTLIDRSSRLMEQKLANLEKIIEQKVTERVEKLQTNSIVESMNKNIQENIRKEFSNQFERVVTPSFEKYLAKVFEQIMFTFERGQKFYMDKLTLEQQKNN